MIDVIEAHITIMGAFISQDDRIFGDILLDDGKDSLRLEVINDYAA